MMKKLFYVPLALMLTMFLQCTSEEPLGVIAQKIQFTIALPIEDDPGGRIAQELPEGALLRISISNSSGPVVEGKEIRLLKIGDTYIAEPLELVAGNYFITDFMIVTGTDVHYATPKEGTPLASLVTTPLPYSFSVLNNEISNFAVHVVSTDNRTAEDFGYVSFGIDIVQPLSIAVVGLGEEGASLLAAIAEIYDGQTIIQSLALDPEVNQINFNGSGDKEYTIKVYAEGGYELYSSAIVYNDLVDELDGEAYKIMLHPALDLGVYLNSYDPETPMGLMLSGIGEIEIEGETEFAGTYQLPVSFENFTVETGSLEHITIKGDIDQITELRSFGYNGGVKTIDGLSHLKALEIFRPGIQFKDALDLTHNENLTYVSLVWVELPEWFTLPTENRIAHLSLDAYNGSENRIITAEEFDVIVDNIYRNAVANQIANGVFQVSALSSLSQSSDAKLKALYEIYGWEIYVDGYDI